MKLNEDRSILIDIEADDIDENGYFKVPDGVKKIDSKASFAVREKLAIIDINSVEEINYKAFWGCENLVQVIGSPKKISIDSFSGCKKLSSFDFSRTTELNISSFQRCGLISVDIRNIDCVPNYAFYECEELCEVIGTPTTIEQNAFCGCTKLVTFNFSKTIHIGYNSFASTGLSYIDIGNVESISSYAFGDCKNLINVNGSPKEIYKYAFYGCEKLAYFDFRNVERLDDTAFLRSKISSCITRAGNIIRVEYKDYQARFATASHHSLGYIIEGIIDEGKNAYADTHGNPFIIDAEYNSRIMYSCDNEQFMQLWSTP